MEEPEAAARDPTAVIAQRQMAAPAAAVAGQRSNRFSVEEVRDYQRQRHAIFGQPPGQPAGDPPQGLDQRAYHRVALARVNPAVEAAAGPGVAEHRAEAGLGIVEVMEHADADHQVEAAEVDT